jgi:hypothetical protein
MPSRSACRALGHWLIGSRRKYTCADVGPEAEKPKGFLRLMEVWKNKISPCFLHVCATFEAQLGC